MKDKQVLNLIGLSKQAGKIVTGSSVLSKIVQVKFLFIAHDMGKNMQKKYENKCLYYHIPYSKDYSGSELSSAIGYSQRMAIGIIDDGFAKKFKGLLEGGQNGKSN